jgi:hypothetical protein
MWFRITFFVEYYLVGCVLRVLSFIDLIARADETIPLYYECADAWLRLGSEKMG